MKSFPIQDGALKGDKKYVYGDLTCKEKIQVKRKVEKHVAYRNGKVVIENRQNICPIRP